MHCSGCHIWIRQLTKSSDESQKVEKWTRRLFSADLIHVHLLTLNSRIRRTTTGCNYSINGTYVLHPIFPWRNKVWLWVSPFLFNILQFVGTKRISDIANLSSRWLRNTWKCSLSIIFQLKRFVVSTNIGVAVFDLGLDDFCNELKHKLTVKWLK